MAVFRSIRTWVGCLVLAASLGSASIALAIGPDVMQSETPASVGGGDVHFSHARAVADEVLRRREFQRNQRESWWDQKKRQLFGVLERLFGQMSRLGHSAPWLVRSMEWTLFIGAGVGLVVFLMRQLARQRLRIELTAGALRAEVWSREASDWSQRAETYAADAAWRDAVHCIYWAAIVLLESRRAWRHNPTRTPREYVRLLKAGSAQQQALRHLTQIFERTWYGLREVDAAEYTAARKLYDDLITPLVEARHVVTDQLEVERL